jgi:hypothetical protein
MLQHQAANDVKIHQRGFGSKVRNVDERGKGALVRRVFHVGEAREANPSHRLGPWTIVAGNHIYHSWDVRDPGWSREANMPHIGPSLRGPHLLLPALRSPLFGDTFARS